jgi:serine/threonine-protein kinase RsbW
MVASSPTRPVELSTQPAAARHELNRLLVESQWDGDVDGVVLAVHEAMVNAQRHAGGVTHAAADVHGGAVVVEVYDEGGGFGMPMLPEMPDSTSERGRGLFLIRSLAADARVRRSGKQVCLHLRFER